ncbi:MAG: hypothetical protein ACRD21_04580, partial [Vicinamibacteria bacterium]
MDAIKNLINWLSGPTVLFTLATVGFILSLRYTKMWSKRSAAVVFTVMTVFYFVSMFDPNFFLIVAKPDNVPITFVLFLVAFFTWFAMYQGIENDKRIDAGQPPMEKQEEDKVWVWPDLVYVEMLCMILLGIGLMAWSILLPAPLEQPANPSDSPNPSKAPWYFLGLQEMLVYFDPWLAGVVYPTLIIVGLMAIPFMDTNPKGNGYFTFKERRAEIGIFLYGFLVLWVLLVISGTFLRGPNWNFFGPYEYWDQHRVEPLLNVNVSDFFWVKLFSRPHPSNPIVREFIGIILILVYVGVLPVLMSRPKE